MDEYDLYEDLEDSYSELRYITLELMKIAVRKNKPFEEVAKEFITNLFYLQKLIEEYSLLKEASKKPKPVKGYGRKDEGGN